MGKILYNVYTPTSFGGLFDAEGELLERSAGIYKSKDSALHYFAFFEIFYKKDVSIVYTHMRGEGSGDFPTYVYYIRTKRCTLGMDTPEALMEIYKKDRRRFFMDYGRKTGGTLLCVLSSNELRYLNRQ